MPDSTKVLIADTQHLFAQALGVALSAYPDLQVLADRPTTGVQAMQKTLALQPDVLLLDYWMPDMEGPAATERILARDPAQKIILLAWFYGSKEVRRAVDAGAAGFLPKSVDLDRVAEAIRRAVAGDALVFGEELLNLTHTLDERYKKNMQISERMKSLTNRELEVLAILSFGRPIQEVADQLFVTPKTVKAHIGSILKKTGARSHAEALAMARYCGLLR